MKHPFSTAVRAVLCLAVPCTLLAQTPAPAAATPSYADGLSISPQNAQSADQQLADRTACESWSQGQTGFDIKQPNGGVSPGDYTSRRQQFDRAMSACLSARGYSVQPAGPPVAPPPAPPRNGRVAPPPPYVASYSPPFPTLHYQPVHVSISGGPSITTADVGDNFDDGGTVNLGLGFFPVESLPIGIRIDGNYSWYGARDGFLIENNAQIGHQEVYGGDADLQFNLGPHSARSQFYLFGGAGWYRERTTLHQLSGFGPDECDFFFCGAFISATARETTGWRDSWNAGLGWEFALSNYSSLFVEARYRQVGPNDSKESFVPVQVGVRF